MSLTENAGLNRLFNKEPFSGSSACKNIPLTFCNFANPIDVGKKVDPFLEKRPITSPECAERNCAVAEAASLIGLDKKPEVRGLFLDSEMSVTMFHLLAWAESAENKPKMTLYPVSKTATWDKFNDGSVIMEPKLDLKDAVSIDEPIDISFIDICGTSTKHYKEIFASMKQLRKNTRNVWGATFFGRLAEKSGGERFVANNVLF